MRGSVGGQNQDDECEDKLGDANGPSPQGLGRNVGSVLTILAADVPGVIGEGDHVGPGPMMQQRAR